MKKLLIVITILSSFAFNAFAGGPCAMPRENVVVHIDNWYLSDIGLTFCYATELATSKRFEVLDCGLNVVGDIVEGRVLTHWTHKDAQGNPVCDYQQFVPYNL